METVGEQREGGRARPQGAFCFRTRQAFSFVAEKPLGEFLMRKEPGKFVA